MATQLSLEKKKILGLLTDLASAELLFIGQKKAVLVLDGAGENGPKAKGCFEVTLCLDHDEFVVEYATVDGVTPFKPGYIKLDGSDDHDLDGGNLFSIMSNSWADWWIAHCDRATAEFNSLEHYKISAEKLKEWNGGEA
ncbi:hypothetical protein Acife_1992 [Acidithiobacillus ferrivorans SS3]|uniref:Uncharacterized protein n=1 Tax=Acidithiobacillus ferrivorans SS3 TaxID=743299 RepID=G0JM62_9PROT|nr:hypothetical protein [Acidithiobacillus ferrivorans]AEM48112.1 hypothetical protein Acife_1992 [Acidithiobacillus ferrivorans SS3]